MRLCVRCSPSRCTPPLTCWFAGRYKLTRRPWPSWRANTRAIIEPPTLMESFHPAGPAEFTDLLNTPPNSAWLAWDGTRPTGYLRFEGQGFGAAEIVLWSPPSPTRVPTSARPTAGAGPLQPCWMLPAGLRRRGFTCCSVDFEAFNPEAAAACQAAVLRARGLLCLPRAGAPANSHQINAHQSGRGKLIGMNFVPNGTKFRSIIATYEDPKYLFRGLYILLTPAGENDLAPEKPGRQVQRTCS